jgi:hypothetical protein
MAQLSGYHTTGELARRYRQNIWIIRDALDRVGVGLRVGPYRVCPAECVPAVEAELRRRGYAVPETEEVCNVG